jgi:hypothetical protein
MNKILFLSIILILAVGLPIFFNAFALVKESFSNYTLEGASGAYPLSENNGLVQDFYPIIKRQGISNDTANKIWWHYPTFEVGSYDQITNNIRYPNNPDEGTCMPASFCGTFYKEKQLKSNYVHTLPPVNENGNTRVGYFTTDINLPI